MTTSFIDKTVFITGASRGIGRAIALRCAEHGANVVIAAKTQTPHPKLEGTIDTVADEVNTLGGKALALQLDVRDDDAILAAITKTAETFGKIDILVNNAGAISLTSTNDTELKKYDLMHQVNVRATFACSKYALPYLELSSNPHILNLSPPLNMDPKWFKGHVAYTMSKYGMSMCTLGMAEEFKEKGIAVNSLWPKTTIATAAIANNFPKDIFLSSRIPEIMGDAAYLIFTKDAASFTGNFCIDEDILLAEGMTDFSNYSVDPEKELFSDLYVE